MRPNLSEGLAPVRRREQGTALILSLFFSIVVTGLVITGATVLKANKQKTDTSFRLHGQALQFARSGLTEALAWYRRQTSQPVLAFDPIVDTLANPPIIDTDDPDIGIVREFKISGPIWGRYEVWKQWDTDPDPVRLAWRKKMQVRDISIERSLGALGTSWQIRCIGYVFHRTDNNKAFDERPNRVVASRMMETEILRMKISPPGQAAVCMLDSDLCTVDSNGRVLGGATGAGVYCQGGAAPSGSGTVSGMPGHSVNVAYDGTLDSVFGTTLNDLKSVADEVVTNPPDFPSPIPANTLVVADAGALTFTAANPLRGSAVLYVRGDVTIQAGSTSLFNGLLFVDGNLTVLAPADITGTIVVGGNHSLLVEGSGDWATVSFDESVLDTLRKEIGQYRLAGAIRQIEPME